MTGKKPKRALLEAADYAGHSQAVLGDLFIRGLAELLQWLCLHLFPSLFHPPPRAPGSSVGLSIIWSGAGVMYQLNLHPA